MYGKLLFSAYIGKDRHMSVVVTDHLTGETKARGLIKLSTYNNHWIFDAIRVNWSSLAQSNDWTIDLLEEGGPDRWDMMETQFYLATNKVAII